MEYSFYEGYTINDDNIDCGKIITVDCDGNHSYADLCPLISNCLGSIPGQLTSDCVVDFLNTLNTQAIGNFVRINALHCLESVPISFSTSDTLVSCDSLDTPGYLEDKIVGCQDISVSTIGSGNNKQIEICYDGPSSMPDLADVDPGLYDDCGNIGSNSLVGKFLVSDTINNRVDTMCLTKPMGSIFTPSSIIINGINLLKNEIKHFYVGGMGKYWADNGMVVTVPNPGIGTVIGGSITALVATKPGIRKVSMKGNVRVNAGIQAFRVYILSGDNSLNGCVDSKFGASDNPKQPLVRRYDQPITQNTYSYFNVGGSCLVETSNNNTAFMLRVAADSNAGTDIDPHLELFAGGLTDGTYNDPEGNYGNISGLSLQLEFIRDKGFDNKSL